MLQESFQITKSLLFVCRTSRQRDTINKVPWPNLNLCLWVASPVTSVMNRQNNSVTVVRSIYAMTVYANTGASCGPCRMTSFLFWIGSYDWCLPLVRNTPARGARPTVNSVKHLSVQHVSLDLMVGTVL